MRSPIRVVATSAAAVLFVAASPAAGETGSAVAGSSGGVTSVTVTSDRGESALLEYVAPTVVMQNDRRVTTAVATRSWRTVCVAPCTASVDSGGLYRVGSPNVVVSEEIRLPAGPTATIAVNAGSPAARRIGWSLVESGTFLALIGAAAILSGFITEPDASEARFAGEPNYYREASDRAERLRVAGYIVLPIGVVALVVGGVLVAANSTDVTLGSGGPAAAGKRPRAAPQLSLSTAGLHF